MHRSFSRRFSLKVLKKQLSKSEVSRVVFWSLSGHKVLKLTTKPFTGRALRGLLINARCKILACQVQACTESKIWRLLGLKVNFFSSLSLLPSFSFLASVFWAYWLIASSFTLFVRPPWPNHGHSGIEITSGRWDMDPHGQLRAVQGQMGWDKRLYLITLNFFWNYASRFFGKNCCYHKWRLLITNLHILWKASGLKAVQGIR